LLPELLAVARLRRETPDTFTLELDATQRGGFRFQPGQFNMLYGFGAGESAISIAGNALVHTVRAVGTVTRVLGELRRGDLLGVRGPFGRGWPLAEARGRHLLLVAGGIGLAPLRSLVLHAISHPDEFRSATLVYGARTERELLYRNELARWAAAMPVEVTVDRGSPRWAGHTGVVTKLLAASLRDANDTSAMICGPEVMMRFAARELVRLGVPESGIAIATERNMKCGVGLCGHCQLGPFLLCRDGPVFRYDRIRPWLAVREL
jgi:NAD(P)H-flavin reductase